MLVTAAEDYSDEFSDEDELVHGPIISADLSLQREEPLERKRNFTTLGICCCTSVLCIGVALALMSRLASEGDHNARSPTVLAVFSFGNGGHSTQRNQALAWVTSELLKGKSLSSISHGDHVDALMPRTTDQICIPDGNAVRSWHPSGHVVDGSSVFVHGEVAREARDSYGLTEVATIGDLVGSDLPETDSFVYIYRELAERANGKAVEPTAVVISHPHHLPYLAVLAAAARFRVLVLPAPTLSHMRWSDFNCTQLGYAAEENVQEVLQMEQKRLNEYAAELGSMDPALARVVEVANATLQYYHCAVNTTDATQC
mmetsp:Transcript_13342/g.29968  ORF Transcript_13342/g.29968 Transcript_13342/m.29968 type:complete len:315 (-) Transcript_13342:8-952(-)